VLSADAVERLKPLVKEYVEKSADVVNVQWDPQVTRELPFDPYARTSQIAQYFLLAAAITETELVGRSENTRALLIDLSALLGNTLFTALHATSFAGSLAASDTFGRLPAARAQIPEVLASVNRFVRDAAGGDLIQYAKTFPNPAAMVRALGEHVLRMGGRHANKAWMYLRWMVRQHPDLHTFRNFRSSDLEVPLTSAVRDVAVCLGLCPPAVDWEDVAQVAEDRRRVTAFVAAADLFPEDPTIVDYPFYVLGRWMRGQPLSLPLLRDYLTFWRQVYGRLGRAPVTFDVISRQESAFERAVSAQLQEMQVLFGFEPAQFWLPGDGGAPHYTPDFVLPHCKKNGKTVILEPHGVWTPLERRQVTVGDRTFPLWTYPTYVDADEAGFVRKLRAFKEVWGGMYHVILIVPSTVVDRVEQDYGGVFDEICEGGDVPRLLYELKQRRDRA
jgi:hypothetical protein